MFRYLLLFGLLSGVLVATAKTENNFLFIDENQPIDHAINLLKSTSKDKEIIIEKTLNIYKISCHSCNNHEFTEFKRKLETEDVQHLEAPVYKETELSKAIDHFYYSTDGMQEH